MIFNKGITKGVIIMSKSEELLLYFGLKCESNNITNYSKKYIFEDVDGYKYKTSLLILYNSRKRGNIPARFFNKNPYTRYNIELYISKNNYNIKLDESISIYKNKNAKSKLKFVCLKHGTYHRNWNELFSNNSSCPVCGKNLRVSLKRNSYDYICNYYKNNGYELISNHYGNNEHNIYVKCSKHGIFSTTFGNSISSKCICPECLNDNNNNHDFEFEKYLKKYNLEIIDTHIDSKNRITFMCHNCGSIVKHNVKYIRSSGFKCRKCKEKDGELSKSRDAEMSKEWRRSVYYKYNYKCDICGTKGSTKNINAHHLNGWNWFTEGRFDVDNGVCLCEYHHIEFHKTYGSGDNTLQQYNEFKDKKGLNNL